MIAPKDPIEASDVVAGGGDPGSDKPLPNSRKVYVSGSVHPDIRVPFREISLAPTKSMNGEIELNEPVRVYDTSGPWGDPEFHGKVEEGLPGLRAKWIRDRGDVEEYEGRTVRPIDDGYLSDAHANHSARRNGSSQLGARSLELGRKPLRAKPGNCVTQLAYARRGIITPEMEFIAIRENGGREDRGQKTENGNSATEPAIRHSSFVISRNDLVHHHNGNAWGANIPDEITPEYVRDEVARGRAIIPANINHPES
jgi:phosphomethylpyrimidine synthase